MVCNLREFKEFIDNEMIVILGQMDSPTEIFEHVFLVRIQEPSMSYLYFNPACKTVFKGGILCFSVFSDLSAMLD